MHKSPGKLCTLICGKALYCSQFQKEPALITRLDGEVDTKHDNTVGLIVVAMYLHINPTEVRTTCISWAKVRNKHWLEYPNPPRAIGSDLRYHQRRTRHALVAGLIARDSAAILLSRDLIPNVNDQRGLDGAPTPAQGSSTVPASVASTPSSDLNKALR